MMQQALKVSYSKLTGIKSTANIIADLKHQKDRVLVAENKACLLEKANFSLSWWQERRPRSMQRYKTSDNWRQNSGSLWKITYLARWNFSTRLLKSGMQRKAQCAKCLLARWSGHPELMKNFRWMFGALKHCLNPYLDWFSQISWMKLNNRCKIHSMVRLQQWIWSILLISNLCSFYIFIGCISSTRWKL